MKKTIYIWVIIVLISISVLTELLSIAGLTVTGLSSYYGSNVILNYIAVISLVLDIIISLVFLYNLVTLKKDVLLWTNIAFGYTVLRLLFAIFADVVSIKGTALANSIEIVIILVIWSLFYKHLKKIFITT